MSKKKGRGDKPAPFPYESWDQYETDRYQAERYRVVDPRRVSTRALFDAMIPYRAWAKVAQQVPRASEYWPYPGAAYFVSDLRLAGKAKLVMHMAGVQNLEDFFFACSPVRAKYRIVWEWDKPAPVEPPKMPEMPKLPALPALPAMPAMPKLPPLPDLPPVLATVELPAAERQQEAQQEAPQQPQPIFEPVAPPSGLIPLLRRWWLHFRDAFAL